mgnify:CR=1 FL=1
MQSVPCGEPWSRHSDSRYGACGMNFFVGTPKPARHRPPPQSSEFTGVQRNRIVNRIVERSGAIIAAGSPGASAGRWTARRRAWPGAPRAHARRPSPAGHASRTPRPRPGRTGSPGRPSHSRLSRASSLRAHWLPTVGCPAVPRRRRRSKPSFERNRRAPSRSSGPPSTWPYRGRRPRALARLHARASRLHKRREGAPSSSSGAPGPYASRRARAACVRPRASSPRAADHLSGGRADSSCRAEGCVHDRHQRPTPPEAAQAAGDPPA